MEPSYVPQRLVSCSVRWSPQPPTRSRSSSRVTGVKPTPWSMISARTLSREAWTSSRTGPSPPYLTLFVISSLTSSRTSGSTLGSRLPSRSSSARRARNGACGVRGSSTLSVAGMTGMPLPETRLRPTVLGGGAWRARPHRLCTHWTALLTPRITVRRRFPPTPGSPPLGKGSAVRRHPYLDPRTRLPLEVPLGPPHHLRGSARTRRDRGPG